MRTFLRLALVTILPLFAATGAAAQQQGAPQTVLKATHGAWEVRCDANDQSRCIMLQDGKNDKGETIVQALLRKTPGMKTEDNQEITAVIDLLAPIGVYLPAGIEMKIDGRTVGRGVYQVCNPQACLVREPLSAEVIAAMKKGANALMVIRGANGEAAEVAISLSGFTRAYDGL